MGKNYWEPDRSHTRIAFKARHMLITNVTGRFKEYDIQVITEEDDFRNAEIKAIFKTNSLDTGVRQRNGHLMSDDFFNAEEYPEIVFQAEGLNNQRGDSFELTGELTIRDITKPVTFKVKYAGKLTDISGEERAAFELTGEIDRLAFGLKWNALMETGGAVVGRKIKVDADIELVKNQELSSGNELLQSLQAASKTLNSQLPDPARLKDLVRDGFVFHRAKGEVGGDFYWYDTVNDKKVIVLADGVGHGMEGSLKAMMGLSLINRVMNDVETVEPREILHRLDYALKEAISRTHDLNTELFALEAGVLVIDDDKQRFLYAGTGIYLIYQNDRLELQRLSTDKVGLGSENFNPEQLTVYQKDYQPGESVFLFSDGLPDQFGGPRDKKLTVKRLEEWMAATSFMEFSQVGNYLQHQFFNWTGNNEQVDDVTLIGAML